MSKAVKQSGGAKKIAVLGLGYVGLPLALLAAKKGHKVVGVELDKEKVDLINKQQSPIEDPLITDDLAKYPFKATTKVEDTKSSDIFIICVPTPVKDDFRPNLKPLQVAARDIAKILKPGQLVIVESTVNPGVCEEVVLPILEETGLKAGKDFSLAHCPERINPGDRKWTIENIPRVVGSTSKEGLEKAVGFYSSIIEGNVRPMDSVKEAEAVKIVENAFRDINLAFVNELAISFSKLGINATNVINGAATKPFAFMPHYPGAGVGGHCIPVDPYYLIEKAKGEGFDHEFLTLARKINNKMPEFTVEVTQDALNEVGLPVKGTRIALLGLAYKPNVDDDRNSPAYEIQRLLKELGAEVVAYDPHLPAKSNTKSLKEAIDDSQAIVIVTSHDEFKSLNPSELGSSNIKAVIDGRNIFHTQKQKFTKNGIVYYGIGV